MKTFTKTFAVAMMAGILSFTSVFAGDRTEPATSTSYKVGMYVSQKTMVLNVMVEKPAGKPVIIRLKDKEGQLLAMQAIKRNGERAWSRFNLSGLNDGTYQVEITNGDEITRKDITLSTQKPVEVTRTLVVK